MNKERRGRVEAQIGRINAEVIDLAAGEELKNIESSLSDIACSIEFILDDEQDAFDNMPEGLQMSARGQTSEECIDLLTEAIDQLQTITDEMGDDSNPEEIAEQLESVGELLWNVINA